MIVSVKASVIHQRADDRSTYYHLFEDHIQTFPDDFRMISGDSLRRNSTIPVMTDIDSDSPTQYIRQQKALGFTCLDYSSDQKEVALGRHALPDKNLLDSHCTDGLRLELMFPSCRNGIDVASDNHKSHVAFPTRIQEGDCLQGFQIRLPVLYYETIWNTARYRDMPGMFLLPNGDETGFGYYGDLMSA